jgi:hypothetical protein
MSSGAEWWDGHAGRDRANTGLIGLDGEATNFDELLRQAPQELAAQLTMDVWEAKYARAQGAAQALASQLADAAPDVVVVVGDDQRELFEDDGTPSIGLFLGDEIWDLGLSEERKRLAPPDILPAQWAAHAEAPEPYPVAKELSAHLAAWLTDAEFDVTVCTQQAKGRTLGHAFTFVRRRLGIPVTTPIMPVFLNTYYPPNVPSPGRCWKLGEALRAGIDAWPSEYRVAAVASGGLSHFVVNEKLDQRMLAAMAAHDGATLSAIPRRFFRSGTSEGLNWIVVAAMLHDFEMSVIDYIPGYRSSAGTGTAMAYASWAPSRREGSAC